MSKKKRRRRNRRGRGWLIALLIVLGILLLAVGAYITYVFTTYYRLEDKISYEAEEPAKGQRPADAVALDTTYTIMTQNFGFGAYTPDFTFFMDGGKQSWAVSESSVKKCLNLCVDNLMAYYPDFILLQEVDRNSTRSYYLDEAALFAEKLPGFTYSWVQNYDSPYLFYPFTEPHGFARSGMMVLSDVQITSVKRRSLPISESVTKIVDLDRCYTVNRIPVESGKELVLYNVHLSAYGGSDEIRDAQTSMLFNDMKAEYEAGNYCICGGDFNHDFTGTSVADLNDGLVSDMGWVQPFPADALPEHISRALDYSTPGVLPTCRNCDEPYKKGNFTVIVDGFIISDNVVVELLDNLQTGFAYSDHNPVVMRFHLAG